MSLDKYSFNAGLKAYRRLKGISRRELCAGIGVTQPTLARFEKNPKLIRLDYFLAMADFFKISHKELFDILFGGEQNED